MTYYIRLYVGAKRLVFHLSPRDSHVIIVSGCLILAAVNLIVLIRMGYITKRLVELCKIYWDIWHRLTWRVCTGGRTLRHNQIFLPMVLRSARASRARGAPLLGPSIRSWSASTCRQFLPSCDYEEGPAFRIRSSLLNLLTKFNLSITYHNRSHWNLETYGQ